MPDNPHDLSDASLMAMLDALMSEAGPDGMPSERARAVAAKVPDAMREMVDAAKVSQQDPSRAPLPTI